MKLDLTSSAFQHNGDIPRRYTCDGENISPPIAWSGIPERTKSLALIVDDPDAPDPAAPTRTWVHWILYNIPPGEHHLAENCGARGGFAEALDGTNDWSRTGFGGPCPPVGRHRYFHKLYALDTVLPRLQTPDKAHLTAAMQGHILAEATLIGGYQSSKR